jgi:hypothetical protein
MLLNTGDERVALLRIPWGPAILTAVLHGFAQAGQANSAIGTRIRNCRFPPRLFQFIIRQSSYDTVLYCIM